MNWKRGQVALTLNKALGYFYRDIEIIPVQGYICEEIGLAITRPYNKNKNKWDVIHIQSGYRVENNIDSLITAKRYAEIAATFIDFKLPRCKLEKLKLTFSREKIWESIKNNRMA